MAVPVADGWTLFVEQPPGRFVKIELTLRQAEACKVLSEDGAGNPKRPQPGQQR
jgi:hypothetical protein